ncbi:MAG: hypothetical protein ACKVPJ_07240 [Chitinophagales bacterium]
MKKLSYFTIALALSVLVACKGKDKKEEGADDEMEDMTEQVEQGASDQMTSATDNSVDAATKDMDAESELFGTDVDDSKTGL